MIALKLSDLLHAAVVGEQVLAGILEASAGAPASLDVSVHGKSYTVTVTPK